jgi:serine/threonine protein kinase
LFYVMPFVTGETLSARLARDGPLPIDDALRITREVGRALSYAHAAGIVHRDLKPGNVMLSDGVAVVTDFGIARLVGDAAQQQLTQTGLVIGTPAYMSPEQAMGDAAAVSPASDQYDLACVLFEMLSGRTPFQGRRRSRRSRSTTRGPFPTCVSCATASRRASPRHWRSRAPKTRQTGFRMSMRSCARSAAARRVRRRCGRPRRNAAGVGWPSARDSSSLP